MNNKEILLNAGWKFKLCEKKDVQKLDFAHFLPHTKAGTVCGYVEDMLIENDWNDVDVPYDWGVILPFENDASPTHGFKKMGRGAFLRTFVMDEDISDKTVYLEFEGVRGDSIIYVNGNEAVRNRCGYNGFSVDITPYIKMPGELNWIYAEIDASRLEGWWYEGAGIYRDVKLYIKDKVHFDINGIYAVPLKKENGWVVSVEAEVINTTSEEQTFNFEIELNEKNVYSQDYKIDKETEMFKVEIPVDNPKLWSPENPNLYNIKCRCNSEEETFKIGFRTIETNINDGLLLNGEKYEIKGTCVHQDHAGVGIALTKSVIRYRMEQIKKLGFNAYRSAHHPATPYLMEVCDELGIFVLNENRNFSASPETLNEVEAMVKYSRNHPSLFMYSLFNEEGLQKGSSGYRITKKIKDTVRKYDYYTPTTAALLYNECIADGNGSEALDIAGFNYMMNKYEEFHEKYPETVILGTENSLVFSTRGIYETDEDKQYFDNSGENIAKGAEGHHWGDPFQGTVAKAREYPYVIGVFLWCAFDYRGEPAPYYAGPSVSSHWGIMDSCGYFKDSSYIVKSIYDTNPVLHIVPSVKGGQVTAFTNCSEAELFADGVSCGKAIQRNYKVNWDVTSAKTLKAVGVKDGVVIEDEVIFADEKYSLKIENATKNDVDSTFVLDISAVDKNGVFVQDADDEISVEIENGVLLGIGNGNPTSREADNLNKRKLFNGRCQAIVRATGIEVKCTVSAENLISDTIKINAKPLECELKGVYNQFDLSECIRYEFPVELENAKTLEWTTENKLNWHLEVFYDITTLFNCEECGGKLYQFNTEKLKGKTCKLYIKDLKGELVVIHNNDVVWQGTEDGIVTIDNMSDKLKLFVKKNKEFNLKLPIAIRWE